MKFKSFLMIIVSIQCLLIRAHRGIVDNLVANADEGYLNSTIFTLKDGEKLQILDIIVTERVMRKHLIG
ncbi:MAG: hypothetical protein II984_07230 [Clostridia bacterium]|nr:hypothetical protein [Clostridia bacterium]